MTTASSPDTTPDISVIIPAYDAMPYLTRSLTSVVEQTIGTDRLEIILVDDGSKDDTGAEADRWAERYPGLFTVRHAEGSGSPAKPRNTALDLARGRYVFFLDADDYLGPEALERLLAVAEREGSEIVMGRLRSAGTRPVPELAYRRTDLDADLFTSKIYWNLAALKLFRRDFLEAHAIRFPTHLPNQSDLPFSAIAYLRADKISVLADYDYYWVVLRDDGRHVTLSGTLANLLLVVEEMCALLAREVPDAEQRATLLQRHFQLDLRHVMEPLADAPPAEQEELRPRIARVIREHASPELMARLRPDLRIVYHLAGRGLLPEAFRALAFDYRQNDHEITVEDGRVIAHLPYHDEPSLGVPREYYDVTDKTRAAAELTSFRLDAGVLHVAGTAGFALVVPSDADTVTVLLRRVEDRAVVHELPAERTAGAGFECRLDLRRPGQVPAGRLVLTVRVARGGFSSDAPLAAAAEIGPGAKATATFPIGPRPAEGPRRRRRANAVVTPGARLRLTISDLGGAAADPITSG